MMQKVLIIFAVLCAINCAKFPSDIEKCKLNENKCFVKVANQIVLKSAEGYPALGLPSLEPLHIKKIGINQGGDRPVVMDFQFNNLDVYGLTTSKFNSIEGFGSNIEKGVIDMKLTIEKFQMIGPYKAKGKILVLPMNGDGNANITFSDVDVHIRSTTEKIVKNNKNYMQLNKIRLVFDPKDLQQSYTNLFNGNKLLKDEFDRFVNENWRDILVELKPAMQDAISSIFKQLINNIFINIPYEEFFKE